MHNTNLPQSNNSASPHSTSKSLHERLVFSLLLSLHVDSKISGLQCVTLKCEAQVMATKLYIPTKPNLLSSDQHVGSAGWLINNLK